MNYLLCMGEEGKYCKNMSTFKINICTRMML